MSVLLIDTNVVSILFNRTHSLRQQCIEVVAGSQLAISFMTRAELLLWPAANNWGEVRRSNLGQHLALYTTLYSDERTCDIWVEVVDRCRRSGQRIQTADAWIASVARQWQLPLVTTDFRDYEAIDDLEVVPIKAGPTATDR
ncbi:MAG TPA: PIN domain-containing protein [Bryobacteraceae bacterium]|nr:PIN domain-containing protein [Bryobacteraceae bacterium]